MTDNSRVIPTVRDSTSRVSIVCADCLSKRRSSAQSMVAVHDEGGWTVLDASRQTFLAGSRSYSAGDRELDDNAAASGYKVTDRKPPLPVVYRPGAIGKNPDYVRLRCRNGDCGRDEEWRTTKLLKRVSQASTQRLRIVKF